MPGNVSVAAVTTVLPDSLAAAYSLAVAYQVNDSVYKSGEYQASLLVPNERRSWKLTRRLPHALADALAAFYIARGGPAQSFYFYDPFGVPGSVGGNYDATGVATPGRYAVRFEGGFAQTMGGPGRQIHNFTLVELADHGGFCANLNNGHGKITAATVTAAATFLNPGAIDDTAGVTAQVTGGSGAGTYVFWGIGHTSMGSTSTVTLAIDAGDLAFLYSLVFLVGPQGTLLAVGPTCTITVTGLSLNVTYLDSTTATLQATTHEFTPGDYTDLISITNTGCVIQQERYGGLLTMGAASFSGFPADATGDC